MAENGYDINLVCCLLESFHNTFLLDCIST